MINFIRGDFSIVYNGSKLPAMSANSFSLKEITRQGVAEHVVNSVEVCDVIRNPTFDFCLDFLPERIIKFCIIWK